MRIIGLINKDSGPGMHRILMPLLLMNDIDAYITNNSKPEDFDNCDAIYYNRVVNEDLLKLVRKKGKRIIVDVDDYWILDQHHIAYEDYMLNDFESLQCKHLWFADMVTTTHERLAEKIYPYNKNVVICQNAIPDHEYFPVERTESEKTRIFWQGSITHEKDIELLRNPVRRLDRNKYLMVIAGYTNHPAWGRMVNYYTNGLNLKGVVLNGVSPFEYYKNYSCADICLAPLIESRFNSYKSNLKILEAAHSSLPVIASHVHPYLDMPLLYAKKQSDWVSNISLLNDKSARQQAGKELKEYCDKHYNFHLINEARKQAILR